MALTIEHLDHFGVDVSDLQRAEEFYTKVLGMRVEMRLPDQILLRYADGSCALFLKPDRPAPDSTTIRHPLGKSHHAFRVRHAELAIARQLFTDRGILYHAPIDWGDHECLYFLDPDGNLLELVGYRESHG